MPTTKPKPCEFVMGIDPGLATTGFAILQCFPSTREPKLKDCGVITTSKQNTFVERLMEIEASLFELIRSNNLSSVAVETLFFAVNKKTALDVAHARGIILRALHVSKLPITEYSPLQVKKAITGHGQANKLQVQGMVAKLLHTNQTIQQDDAADAIAIALCHSNAHAHLGGIHAHV